MSAYIFMNKKYSNKELLYGIGRECAEFRISIHRTQKDVARDLGYSYQEISAFEQGRINSIHILFWYIEKGINIHGLIIRLEQKGLIKEECKHGNRRE